ncbi:unnamed protein product [Calypogeia fissa]
MTRLADFDIMTMSISIIMLMLIICVSSSPPPVVKKTLPLVGPKKTPPRVMSSSPPPVKDKDSAQKVQCEQPDPNHSLRRADIDVLHKRVFDSDGDWPRELVSNIEQHSYGTAEFYMQVVATPTTPLVKDILESDMKKITATCCGVVSGSCPHPGGFLLFHNYKIGIKYAGHQVGECEKPAKQAFSVVDMDLDKLYDQVFDHMKEKFHLVDSFEQTFQTAKLYMQLEGETKQKAETTLDKEHVQQAIKDLWDMCCDPMKLVAGLYCSFPGGFLHFQNVKIGFKHSGH